MTSTIQLIFTLVWSLFSMVAMLYAAILLLWILGLPPFHKPTVDTTAIPITTIPIPTAVCPRCGYKSTEFIALAQKLQHEEFTSDDG